MSRRFLFRKKGWSVFWPAPSHICKTTTPTPLSLTVYMTRE